MSTSIGEINKIFFTLGNRLEKEIIEAQKITAEKMLNDVKELSPIRTGTYRDSMQVTEPKVESTGRFTKTISTKVFNDVMVGGSNPKWQNVPLGCLLEWGTGMVGAMSNTYPHGYPYRLTPWVYYDPYYNEWVTTNGMVARPHFKPALDTNKTFYKQQLREAVRRARKR